MQGAERLIAKSEEQLKETFRKLDEISYFNQVKVIKAFHKNRVALRHFSGSTGYGYGDEGRDTLNQVFADVFGAESALVSPNIVSGTHALTVGLFGLLRAGDTLFSISGNPYDTLQDVIAGKDTGSLADFGISFEKADLKDGRIRLSRHRKRTEKSESQSGLYPAFPRATNGATRYRRKKISEACAFVRKCGFQGCIFVDNCYGEFVETSEPTQNGRGRRGGFSHQKRGEAASRLRAAISSDGKNTSKKSRAG